MPVGGGAASAHRSTKFAPTRPVRAASSRCALYAEVDREGVGDVEQLDDRGPGWGVVAGQEDHLTAARLMGVCAQDIRRQRLGGLDEPATLLPAAPEAEVSPSIRGPVWWACYDQAMYRRQLGAALAPLGLLLAAAPAMVATSKHIAADVDLVAVRWPASASPDDEFTGQAVIDVWRLAAGRIVEHWDGFQNVPAESVSGYSMFSDVYTYPQGAPPVS